MLVPRPDYVEDEKSKDNFFSSVNLGLAAGFFSRQSEITAMVSSRSFSSRTTHRYILDRTLLSKKII